MYSTHAQWKKKETLCALLVLPISPIHLSVYLSITSVLSFSATATFSQVFCILLTADDQANWASKTVLSYCSERNSKRTVSKNAQCWHGSDCENIHCDYPHCDSKAVVNYSQPSAVHVCNHQLQSMIALNGMLE